MNKCDIWEYYTSSANIEPAYYYNCGGVYNNFKTINSDSCWGTQYRPEDTWTVEQKAVGYYVGEPSNYSEISVIARGTFPQFYWQVYELEQNDVTVRLERTDSYLKIYTASGLKRYYDSGWTLVKNLSASQFKDNIIPKRVIVELQGAGGAGGNYSGSDSGGGGGSGAYWCGILNLGSFSHPTIYLGSKGNGDFTNGHQGYRGGFGSSSYVFRDGNTSEPSITVGGGEGGYGADGSSNNGLGGNGGKVTTNSAFITLRSKDGGGGTYGGAQQWGKTYQYLGTKFDIYCSNYYTSETYNSQSRGGYFSGSVYSGDEGTGYGGGGGAPSAFAKGGACGVSLSGDETRPGAGSKGSGGGGGTDEDAYNTNDPQGWGADGGSPYLIIWY